LTATARSSIAGSPDGIKKIADSASPCNPFPVIDIPQNLLNRAQMLQQASSHLPSSSPTAFVILADKDERYVAIQQQFSISTAVSLTTSAVLRILALCSSPPRYCWSIIHNK
jgi:hypothetical protein